MYMYKTNLTHYQWTKKTNIKKVKKKSDDIFKSH